MKYPFGTSLKGRGKEEGDGGEGNGGQVAEKGEARTTRWSLVEEFPAPARRKPSSGGETSDEDEELGSSRKERRRMVVPSSDDEDDEDDAARNPFRDILKKHFKLDSFRRHQLEGIEARRRGPRPLRHAPHRRREEPHLPAKNVERINKVVWFTSRRRWCVLPFS